MMNLASFLKRFLNRFVENVENRRALKINKIFITIRQKPLTANNFVIGGLASLGDGAGGL